MTEFAQGWLATGAWLAIAGFATLYWLGGRDGTSKSLRRVWGGLLIAGATIGLSLFAHTFHWVFLLSLVTMPAALSLGYGADSTATKISRRALFGLAVSANSLIFALPLAMIGVAVFQILLGVGASVFFGVANPFNNAAKEEAVIGGLSVVLIPFIV